ncbi:hypothetical protein BDY19DRAFT_1049617 [Irpex rosettiformis]|uniref:Uncharacterized protein n=1 Tax=Irpex rosettiformis TaxID=378272 RepID=A0ACB8TXY2_9APHY|nr:hypothetical protein BDY19DRAFT_1049617 [Irpex rosettiformis]
MDVSHYTYVLSCPEYFIVLPAPLRGSSLSLCQESVTTNETRFGGINEHTVKVFIKVTHFAVREPRSSTNDSRPYGEKFRQPSGDHRALVANIAVLWRTPPQLSVTMHRPSLSLGEEVKEARRSRSTDVSDEDSDVECLPAMQEHSTLSKQTYRICSPRDNAMEMLKAQFHFGEMQTKVLVAIEGEDPVIRGQQIGNGLASVNMAQMNLSYTYVSIQGHTMKRMSVQPRVSVEGTSGMSCGLLPKHTECGPVHWVVLMLRILLHRGTLDVRQQSATCSSDPEVRVGRNQDRKEFLYILYLLEVTAVLSTPGLSS